MKRKGTKKFKTIDSDLNAIPLSSKDICLEEISSGNNAPQQVDLNRDGNGIPFIRVKDLNNTDSHYNIIPQEYISFDNSLKYRLRLFKKGAIVFPKSGQSVNTNNIGILGQDSYVVNHLAVITCKNTTIRDYVFYLLKYYQTSNFKLDDNADYPTLSLQTIKKFKIPYSFDSAKKVSDEINTIDRNMNKRSVEEAEINVLNKYVYSKK